MGMTRRCDFYKATDEFWYLILGNFEFAEEDEDCSFFGPFDSQEEANDFLVKSPLTGASPTGAEIDDSGTKPPPDVGMLEKIR